MAEEVQEAPASPAPAKKGKATPKKPRKKTGTTPSHPKISQMVNAAITNLKERGGSSLQAIKKYIASNYKVDIDRLSPFLKKYLRTASESGALVRTKGTGAAGSFRLPGTGKGGSPAPAKAKAPKKKATAKKATTAAKKPKKAATPKKTAVKKATKSPAAKKAKKAAPAAAKKPKAAKPKTPKKPKKAAPKKKSPAKGKK